MSKALKDIQAERLKQIAQGWALALIMIKLKFDVRRLDRRIDRLIGNRT